MKTKLDPKTLRWAMRQFRKLEHDWLLNRKSSSHKQSCQDFSDTWQAAADICEDKAREVEKEQKK